MGEIKARSLHPTHYSDEEVKAILEVALGIEGKEFSRLDLVTMAQQLGISEAQLQTAENTYFERVQEHNQKQVFIAERRKKALQEGASYAVLCIVAYLVFLSGFGILPAIAVIAFFPLLFMGIHLLAQGVTAIFETTGEEFEKAFDEWLERREARQRKRLKTVGK